MSPETAKQAVTFLKRTSLTGEEVPQFTQVMVELHQIIQAGSVTHADPPQNKQQKKEP